MRSSKSLFELSLPRLFAAALLVLLLGGAAAAQRGGRVVHQSLPELVDEATYILRGAIESARVERHPDYYNIRTVVVTLRVEEALKGNPGAKYTFRQFIWDPLDETDAAGYSVGDHVLLMLIKPSEVGLSSPVGLQQGRFTLSQNTAGEWLAVNGHGNVMLFRNAGAALRKKGITLDAPLAAILDQHKTGPIKLDDLRAMIRQIARGN